MLQDAAALSCYLEIVRAESGGILRVGVITSILPYFLAPRLRDFVEKFPAIDCTCARRRSLNSSGKLTTE